MAISFTNHWKNIIDELQSVLESEFKGALPVCLGDQPMHSTQYIRLLPTSSEVLGFTTSSEEREYRVDVIFYFDGKIINETTMDHILRYVSRIEALIHNNIIMTLSDSTTALNCRIQSTELNTAVEGIYTVEMNWRCNYVGNIG